MEKMKSEQGITLTSLVIYVIVATILISTMALISSFFFSNMNLVKDQDEYAVEFNQFNMFFIQDIKKNRSAQVEPQKITLEDGTIYQYYEENQSIYRNDTKIVENVKFASFTSNESKIEHTTKQMITVSLAIGKERSYQKQIEYVLKYW